MKIAFWSNIRGRGVTSNLACIGILSAMSGRRLVLLENHLSFHNLENILKAPAKNDYFREEYHYSQIGLGPLIRQMHSGYTYEKKLSSYGLTFLEEALLYLPQSASMNQELFDYEFNQVMKPMLRRLEDEMGVVCIDTVWGKLLNSKKILEEADLIVVSLNQDPAVLDDFFQNYESLVGKCVFLFGRYEKDSIYNLKTIIRKYPINKNKIGVIPYNVFFADAMREGRLVSFLSTNGQCGKKDEMYDFMEYTREATEMVWSYVDLKKKGECYDARQAVGGSNAYLQPSAAGKSI